MKIYIYTIPKAGTYFLADFVDRLGFNNTGYHLSRTSFLNTRKLDLKTNAEFPGQAKESQGFMKTLRNLGNGDAVFGHFPVPLMGWMFPDFRFVCAYRHPRKTLVSEFIDFRFRRKDINWISRETIADDQEAFCAYLERHGEAHMSVFSNMIAATLLRNEELCVRFPAERSYLLNFETLLKDPGEAGRLAGYLGSDPQAGMDALEATLAAETKTKATNIELDRDALWSDRAETAYETLRAEDYARRGRELGWTL